MSLRINRQWTPPRVILDSINETGKRITAFELCYPKMVHGDFMTHRVFSRNASSSRAIPTSKLSVTTRDNLYVPLFRRNRPGMQPGSYLEPQDQATAANVWQTAADACLYAAQVLSDPDGLNVHKQWTNRMLEWFGYINVMVTATDYRNFIALREELDDDMLPMAQDEIYFQATGVRDLLASHEPTRLAEGQWHIPWILPEETAAPLGEKLKISAARSAALSYRTVDGKPMDYQRAIVVYNKLVTANRMHASPLEHQAQADPFDRRPDLHGNLNGGWIQYRKTLPGEWVPG